MVVETWNFLLKLLSGFKITSEKLTATFGMNRILKICKFLNVLKYIIILIFDYNIWKVQYTFTQIGTV